MAKQRDRRDGSIIMHTEDPANAKYADGIDKRTGGLIFKNVDRAREYAKGERDRTGRILRVDPDGGIPRGREMEEMRARERAEARAKGRGGRS